VLKKTDIVLLKPGSQKQLYGDLGDLRLTAIEPPLWAALLAGYLRSRGYSVVLYDAEAENWNYEETARKAAEADPVLVAVVVSGSNPSASTMNMSGAGKMVSLLRQFAPHSRTLLWGLHPSALPEQTLAEENVDFVCRGEGFFTLPPLIDALKTDTSDFQIEGLWYKKDNQVVSNPWPPLMKNLDEVPMPAWDLLSMEKYRAHNWHCFSNIEERQPYGILYTSLGCPYSCTFCCINALFGKRVIRYRSLGKVIGEIDFLVNTYGIKNIKIVDEMFALDEKRIVSLCGMIAERGYNLNMWAYARVNTVTERMLEKMKQAGINWIAYGFESGSKRVIESVAKNYRMEKVQKVVDMTYGMDLHICSNFIFGLPEDDYNSMNETLTLMQDINAEWANIYCAMAYPGSRLYETSLKKGWQLPPSWEGYSQYAYETFPLRTNYLSGGEVLSFRDKAFNAYYANPRYLEMIGRKFGPSTVSHIRELTKKKLERKYADR
jgi:radical SAM superfamily enzyme YgiQ (UPF0313 family)